MKKQLEPYFIANIIQYIDSTITIKRIELINKKCREAIGMIRIKNIIKQLFRKRTLSSRYLNSPMSIRSSLKIGINFF